MRYRDEGPAKAEAINELIKIVQEDAPWTFGYFPTSSAAFHQWVHNGKPTQVVRNHIQYLRLDPETRVKAIKEWNKPIYWPLLVFVLLSALVTIPAVALHRKRERMTARTTEEQVK